ncbi:hypothetical protein F7R01_14390 [Pseudomonas argentinensis]|uniref:dihydrodipicolinate synthase family protein n=1 Tax=Phytopseudomonas argentinensis TaxID=289370 RepID=UPI00111464DE|nr:dihydrodipicolinate synthase family protein [Pseudomonas argentinensis]KAB0548632.1 hypothetical protein F7R01_14390 [Pseudomonas argentinensis]
MPRAKWISAAWPGWSTFTCTRAVAALLVAGPPGEIAGLDFDEHSSLIRRVVERIQGEIPVFAGSSGCIAAISRE